MILAVILAIIFSALWAGSYMSTYLSQKVSFDKPFDMAKSGKVLLSLVDAVAELSDADSVSRRARACRDFLAIPIHKGSDSAVCLLNEITSPPTGDDWCEFYANVQLSAFFKKSTQFDLGIDTRKAAETLFLKSEDLCRETNTLLRDRSNCNYSVRATLLFEMSRKITSILGDAPSFDNMSSAFGPGANVGCSKSTNTRHKLSAEMSTTVECIASFGRIHCNPQTWPGFYEPRLSRGSRFTTVPKTAIIDRGINIEPIFNSFVQKSLGSIIRKRLKAAGVDLNDQTRNQRMAMRGSRTGDLATIDLSMASDLIAYNLVLDLLPIEWFNMLDACRSPEVQMPDGTWIELEKFSSMGNGATFELESLIFYSLLLVIADRNGVPRTDLSVYGDDIICPVSMFDEVMSSLALLGFIPNMDKSFGTGLFRESCGKDFFGGIEVRPVFLKEELSLKELYRLHNFFYRQGYVPSIPLTLVKFMRKHEQTYGPDGCGDGHLVTTHLHVQRDKRGWEPFVLYHSYVSDPKVNRQPLRGDYGAFILGNENGVCSRQRISDTMYQERARLTRFRKKSFKTPVAYLKSS